ncbi:pyridoxal phosphate-dependent aminotransferase [Nesterenkonia salmonea]|uniref:pyridoxal phosphate-dependent aminotransferase n=1 Tax=Nesterenkonia salmonea TaxID=1804987 RepID=UPI001AA06860|nr:aminotransferase class I/II-fold pyridoxal phosphate-dependent enzyme [Nesterenkonia salmonea]
MQTQALASPADRLDEITPSKIRVIFDRAAELEESGEHILHFEIGRPDFDTPQSVKEAAYRALEAGRVHYGPNAGTPQLRRALSEHLNQAIGVEYDPDHEVLVTIGANEAVFLSVMAFCNPGDEVIIPVPAWPAYEACVRLAGATPVFLPLSEENGYTLDPNDVAALLTRRTRMLVLCTPHNPTGAVLDKECLRSLAELLEDSHTLVLSPRSFMTRVLERV